ncbi:MAG: CHAT domain-containing tetratricopeptide repeat protein, partial [Bacteroidota bacterium]
LFIKTARYDSGEHYLHEAAGLVNKAIKTNKKHYDDQFVDFYNVYVNVRSTLASLYHKRGQLYEAINLLEKLHQDIKADLPDIYREYEPYNVVLSNLSTYYVEAGLTDQAKTVVLEYLDLVKPSEEDPLPYLHAIMNMNGLYHALDQPDSSLVYSQKALDYIAQYNLEGHELHIVTLNNIGETFLGLEAYERAHKHLTQAKSIQDKRPAVNPRLYQTTLSNLAENYRWSGDFKSAYPLYDQLLSSLINDIIHNFTYLTNAEKQAFYKSMFFYLENFSSFALEASGALPGLSAPDGQTNPEIIGDLYNVQLMTKAVILNSSYKMKKDILEGEDQNLKFAYMGWVAKKNKLANLYGNTKATAEEIKRLEEEIEWLEKDLTKKSRQFKDGFTVKKVNWQDVQKKLKPGEAAVEMVHLVNGLLYGALILTPETTERPIMAIVASRKGRYLEREFYRQYHNAVQYRIEDTISYNVFWKPIVESIQGHMPADQSVKKVYFSPDGIYNQININTLYDPEKKQYVIDQLKVVRLTNTKELITGDFHGKQNTSKEAILIGRPSFTLNKDTKETPFKDLAGTGTEIEQIEARLSKAQWQVKTFTNESANELNLKSVYSPKVLHIATHGFFKDEDLESQASMSEILLQSGIALAGANDVAYQHSQDGILTALEALTLHLDSTDLVVLSACETGLGQLHPGEGVYGLQRALRSAGAKSVIMSLWKVDDIATQELMTSFYDFWQSSGNVRNAFREAQQNLRNKYPNPYYWGAFVVIGTYE